MRFKHILAGILAAAMVFTSVPTADFNSNQAYAAEKQARGTEDAANGLYSNIDLDSNYDMSDDKDYYASSEALTGITFTMVYRFSDTAIESNNAYALFTLADDEGNYMTLWHKPNAGNGKGQMFVDFSGENTAAYHYSQAKTYINDTNYHKVTIGIRSGRMVWFIDDESDGANLNALSNISCFNEDGWNPTKVIIGKGISDIGITESYTNHNLQAFDGEFGYVKVETNTDITSITNNTVDNDSTALYTAFATEQWNWFNEQVYSNYDSELWFDYMVALNAAVSIAGNNFTDGTTETDMWQTAEDLLYAYEALLGTASCRCKITDRQFDDITITIGAGDANATYDLTGSATATIDSSSCAVDGHSKNTPSVSYKIKTDDGAVNTAGASISGNTLTVTQAGIATIEATITPAIGEATVATLEAEVRVSKQTAGCTCEIYPTFSVSPIEIPYDESEAEIALGATATLGGSCTVAGHSDADLTPIYTITSNTAGASIDNGTLTVSSAGSVTIRATFTANGLTTYAETSVTVTKEAAPTCSCTITPGAFTLDTITIPANQPSAEVTLNATAQYTTDCVIDGHHNASMTTEYALSENAAGATLDGNTLTVTQAGTVIVRAIFRVNGKMDFSEATVTVVKEQSDSGETAGTESTTPDTTSTVPSVTDTSTAQTPATEASSAEQSGTMAVPQKGDIVTYGYFVYKVTGDSTVEVVRTAEAGSKLKKFKIFNSVNLGGKSFKVTSIAKNAFKGNKLVTTVVIGKNIKKIGANAFSGCKKLKKITVKSKVLKKVGKAAFKGVNSKVTVKVPKAKKKAYTKLLKKGGIKTSRIK